MKWIIACMPQLKKRGFTLLETVVALGVILSAIAGPYSLAVTGIINAGASKNKLAAINLAQEGIELVRKIRDDNALLIAAGTLGTNRWDDGITSGDWEIDAVQGTLLPYSGQPLKFDPAIELYQLNSGTPSIFTRRVTIDNPHAPPTLGIPASDQILVRSTVSWSDKTAVKSVSLEEVIYNWQ